MTSNAIGPTEPPLEDTIGRCFEAVARRFPQREALVARHQQRRLTYAELDAQANQLASALLRLGLRAGDRAGIRAGNGHEWVLLQLATAKLGIVLVSIDPHGAPGELETILDRTSCKLLVTIGDRGGSQPSGQGRSPPAVRSPRIAWVVYVDEPHEPGTVPFADLLSLGRPNDPAVRSAGAALRAGEPISIQFMASGGAQPPRGVMRTHRNILDNGFAAGQAMRLREHDRACIPVPLHDAFAMVLGNMACLTHGAAMVYPGAGFDPLDVLQAVQEERCTALLGLPGMFMAELAHPRFAACDLGSLRTGMLAGAACPPGLVDQVRQRMHMAELALADGWVQTGELARGHAAGEPRPARERRGDQPFSCFSSWSSTS